MKLAQRFACLVLVGSVLGVVSGCGKAPEAPKEKVYDVKGKVKAVEPDKKSVTLDHEEIPGFMQAMEMKFSVENAASLTDIKVGDQVHGKLKVKSGGDYVLTDLRK